MTTWAIGDLQGMYDPLQKLLDLIAFDPATDKIWFTGDLVNRGPASLECLRFVRSLGASAITVLGNHDLHLIAATHNAKKLGGNHTLDAILRAEDRHDLIEWLCHRPLIHDERGYLMVHAGLAPQWDEAKGAALAREVEEVLRDEKRRVPFLPAMYGDLPALWREELAGDERWRFVINAMTRLRVVSEQGALRLDYDGPPDERPPGTVHWYDHPLRKGMKKKIICGHWAAQGFVIREGLVALDSGCVWNGALTAYALESGEVRRVSCEE